MIRKVYLVKERMVNYDGWPITDWSTVEAFVDKYKAEKCAEKIRKNKGSRYSVWVEELEVTD